LEFVINVNTDLIRVLEELKLHLEALNVTVESNRAIAQPDHLDLQDKLDCPETMETPEKQEIQVWPEPKFTHNTRKRDASNVPLEKLAHQDLTAHQDLLDQMAILDLPEILEMQASKAVPAQLEMLALQDKMELPAHLDNQALQAQNQLPFLDQKDQVDHLDLLDNQEMLEISLNQELQDKLDQLDLPVNQANPELVVNLVEMVMSALPAQMLPIVPAHLELNQLLHLLQLEIVTRKDMADSQPHQLPPQQAKLQNRQLEVIVVVLLPFVVLRHKHTK